MEDKNESKKSNTRFKKWCIENRMKAADVAEKLGCSRKTVYAYMQGSRLPSRKTERLMKERLDIDTSEIFE